MSPLTKLFVGLLVVLSLLLTAATVTFVNTLDDQRKLADQAKQVAEREKAKADASAAQAQAAEAQARDAERLAQAQVEQLKQQTNTFLKDLNDKDVQLAGANSKLAIQSADVTRLSEALKAFQDSNSRLQEMVNALRTSNDQALQQQAQASERISDLTNKLEVTERDRKFATEQLEEMRNQNAKLGAAVQDMGGNPRQILASATVGAGAGAPKINGVVREVRMIAGLPYATISVGSADSVTKGMEFNVVERNGNFLGKITIDTVELNEATGRLTGPADKVTLIQKGAEVKTQL